MTSLSQLKCLVTGASSGIGLSTCEVLTRYGARVIGSGRNRAALQELKAAGHIYDYVVADVTVAGECERLVEAAVLKLEGELTTVVNAAGILRAGAMGDTEKTNLANYQANMTCNTQAPYEIMCHAIPHLRQTRAKSSENAASNDSSTAASQSQRELLSPSIVNVSSVNGKQVFAGCVTYCMSKAALDQLTRCASVDLAPDGIRVNAVNPGVVTTNIHRSSGLSEDQYAQFIQRSIGTTHPIASSLGRVGLPEEVGELIAFLVSDKARFMTGECIAIDGGRQNLGAR